MAALLSSQQVVESFYAGLYQLHDAMLAKKQAESASLAERKLKEHRLLNQFDDLQELPALSSFLTISDAMEESHANQTDNSSSASAQKDGPKTRDGFERMQRCRMALEALDQV